ncbi:MAG TPA: class I SAM-dependent methyltransferase [Planctomycetaceae bacterium]|nr:class I SAM-dependent methyltransferase [Planctomycetaceae bacterium]
MTDEKEKQEGFAWERGTHYATYGVILGKFIAQSIIENTSGGSLLDLACGDGTLTKMLAPHFDRVVGVDAAASHLEKAKALLPDVEFHHALIEELETEERFDAVTMVCLLEHVINPVEVLKQSAAFLKPEGRIMVHVPNAHAINRRIAVEMGTLESMEELTPFDLDVIGHRRSYTLDTLAAEFEAAGLELLQTGGVFYKMLSSPQLDWLLAEGKWEGNEFGWGRVGAEPKDWRHEFCRSCYEIGKERPEDTNVIFACARRKGE